METQLTQAYGMTEEEYAERERYYEHNRHNPLETMDERKAGTVFNHLLAILSVSGIEVIDA